MSKNVVNWFEIPVADMTRAKTFYEGVFNVTMQDMSNPNGEMFAFPWVQGGENSAGALTKHPMSNPGGNGTVVYFTCDDVENESGRVVQYGGSIRTPKMSLGEFGFMAIATDTEGNVIGLHSQT